MMKHILIILFAFTLLCGFRVPKLGGSHAQSTQDQIDIAYQPKHIALLLPLSGKHGEAARAIKEGFLAAYYENVYLGTSKPIIRVYDTAKETNVQKAYLYAIEQGADFVVGPLAKEEVLRLSQLSQRAMKVPVLALNSHPQSKMIPGKFIQFSLLPESEAEQLAEKAWQNGHRRVGILAVDSPWGHRVASTFSRHWQSLGGQIVQTRFISSREDQTTTIQQFLGIRANQDLKEEPPTPSFDVVMMASDPLQARQLKPLLNFYYAEKIPVYATSSVYSGEPDPMTDHDLNGVIFCDMPWLVNSSRHPSLTATSPDRRLFALGADAYQLTMQIGILKSGKRYAGLTGDLFLVDQQIHRQLTWVKMVKGTPVERF